MASPSTSMRGRYTTRKWSGFFQLKPPPCTTSRRFSCSRSSANFSSSVMLNFFTSSFGKM